MSDTPKRQDSGRLIGGLIAISAIVAISWLWFFRQPEPALPDVRPSPVSSPQARPWAGKRLVFVLPSPHTRSGEAAAEWFQEETGAVVQVKIINYEEIVAAMEKDHASSHPQFDVVALFYPDLVPLASRGMLMELTDYIEQNRAVIKPEDFIPGFYENYTSFQGKRWALPIDGDTQVLFYRKSLFNKHKLKPPETWDEFLHAARTITEKERANGIYGAAIMAHPAPILVVSSFLNRLASFGGELLDSEHRPALASPEAVMALEAMIEHGKYALPTPIETDFDASRSAFLSGRVAMVEQFTDIGIMAEDATQSTIQGDWGVVPIPRGSGPKARRASALNGGFAVAVPRTTQQPELAKAFAQFVTRPDVLLKLNLINGGLDPARLSTLHSPEYKRFAPEISRIKELSLQHTVSWPRVPQASRLLAALSENLVKAMEGHLTAQEALKETETRWIEILRGGEAP